MNALITLAINTLLDDLNAMYRSVIVNFAMEVISWLEKIGIGFFDSAFVSQTLAFTKWLSWLVLGAAFVIMLLDIGEELGGYRPGAGGIEFTTVFINFIKAIAFVLMAPELAVIAMRLAATATGQMTIDYETLRREISGGILSATLGTGGVIAGFAMVIACVAFFIFTLFAVGSVFVQAATIFLYVPDIVRGRETAMGEWIRQTAAIFLTFLFRHLLFVIGMSAAFANDLITMAISWITMFGVARLLQKFGVSSGFGGMVSHAASAGQSFVSIVRSVAA